MVFQGVCVVHVFPSICYFHRVCLYLCKSSCCYLSGEDMCCSGVIDTLIGVYVFSVIL